MSRQNGFTLVELIIVLVLLGVLATIAIPRFIALAEEARAANCRGALGAVRASLANFHAYQATVSADGRGRFPTLEEIAEDGRVVEGRLPVNPYSTAPDRPARQQARRGEQVGNTVTSGTLGAWCYNPETGEFWADTNSGSGESEF